MGAFLGILSEMARVGLGSLGDSGVFSLRMHSEIQ